MRRIGGQTSIEYILVLAMLSSVIFFASQQLRESLSDGPDSLFGQMQGRIEQLYGGTGGDFRRFPLLR